MGYYPILSPVFMLTEVTCHFIVMAGLPEDKLVEAHGTFSSATCVICKHKHETTDVKESIFKDKIPICKKRGCPGIVKPDIVFFGEDLPRRFYYYLKDMINTDLVIIMGTSLEVQPFAGIVDTVKWNIPRVLFNMHANVKSEFLPSDMIESLEKFTDMLSWKNEMVELITNSEGSYKVRTVAASPYKPPPPPKGGPIQNAFMRESARLNLYTGSDSSESETEESSTETETSSSSDDDDTPRARSSPYKRGTINRTRGAKTNGALTRNGYDNSKSGKRNGVLEPSNGGKNKRNYSTTTERSRGTPVSVRSVNSEKSSKPGRSKSVEQNSKDHSVNNRTKSDETNSKGVKSKYRARSVDGSAKGDNQSTARSDISDNQSVRRNKTPSNKNMSSEKNDASTKTKGMKKALSERSLESKVTTKALEGRLKRTSSAKNVPILKENESEKLEEQQEIVLDNDENKSFPKRDKPPIAAKPPLPKPTVPKELQALNARPYGYLAGRRLTGRPTINKNNVIADKTTNKFIRDMLSSQRASSAEIPKIAYRHRLQRRQFYDARILSFNGSENQDSSGAEESSIRYLRLAPPVDK
ncbi:hypothetical protein KUTeg_022677 [Tegillarca granosa]|uniref:Deacetylase sirtuin-type domain-containing protein n=1 Tax=Tegillarca granosa TaxID=220873 RepID=A0ABQ9E4Y1_TEGGR|nr:hypothetical protein KUTeg_022677 [Tegillarca granosa]